ncbi:hypothetical protein LWM68_38530 [Niabella sp. W65]|nr:hypothetical protein [Niabella sp. W65]MCH7368116.1 hypothetical protein [Niabella sp. W65]ULT43733.1 hypothetical protein KRR40_10210 [Niabella sp. I65]
MLLIVVTQFFTNKSTNALTTGNLKAVSTFRLNNRIQEIANLSFDLESKLKGANTLLNDKSRLQSIQDSVTNLGYNAYVLSSFSEGQTRAAAINNIIDTQVNISEKILAALKNSNTEQLKLNIDSLRILDLGNKVYKNCMQLQEELRTTFRKPWIPIQSKPVNCRCLTAYWPYFQLSLFYYWLPLLYAGSRNS